MLARNELIFKWFLYAGAAALCLVVQTALLQRITIWGVIPFLYPLLAAIPATYESSFAGTTFALAVGVAADLLLPGPFSCFYTLIFPFIGLFSAILAQNVRPSGLLRALLAASVAFVLTDVFHMLVLWVTGKAAWSAAASIFLREFCVSLPLAIPVTELFRAVYRKTKLD